MQISSSTCTILTDSVQINAYINTMIKDVKETCALFPNPADNFVTISGIGHRVKIHILDLTGKIIREINSEEETINIFTGNLPAGVYTIQLRTNKTISNLLLNIQHEN